MIKKTSFNKHLKSYLIIPEAKKLLFESLNQETTYYLKRILQIAQSRANLQGRHAITEEDVKKAFESVLGIQFNEIMKRS